MIPLGKIVGAIGKILDGAGLDKGGGRIELRRTFTTELHNVVDQMRAQPVNCAWPSCQDPAIKNSHVVQRAALKTLGAGVVGPKWKGSELIVGPRAVKTATTFPGYCSAHEGIFGKEWESTKVITEQRHRDLQVMRSIDGSLFHLRAELQFAEEALHLLERLVVDVQGFVDETAENLAPLVDELKTLTVEMCARKAHFVWMRNDIMSSLNLAVTPPFGRTASRAVEMPKLPVSLSFCDSQRYVLRSAKYSCSVAIAVIPQSGKSLVLLCTESTDQEFLDSFIKNCLSDERRLATIEAWMLYGTDNWVADAAWWDLLDSAKKAAALERIRNGSESMSEPVGILE